MTIDLDKLEAIARAAQEDEPGEWAHDESENRIVAKEDLGNAFASSIVSGEPIGTMNPGLCCYDSVAEHIAAFSPDVVLKLLHIVKLSVEYESADAGAMSHECDAAYLKWRTAVREFTGRKS